MNFSREYHRLALVVFVSAALHLVVILASGSMHLSSMLVGFILWVAMGFGMIREYRWLTYFVFLFAMFLGIVALGMGMNAFGLAKIGLLGIAASDFIAAILSFLILWKSKPIAME